MRKLLALPILLILGCTTAAPTDPDAPKPLPPLPALSAEGVTIDEEARILALEDRREYDARVAEQWSKHTNPQHRARMALALARIGAHTFIDRNENGRREPTERQAGLTELTALANDPDRSVRLATAFALGEIADLEGARTLFYLTSDTDTAVAAEAAEALSKMSAHLDFNRLQFKRYDWLTTENWAEPVRERAVRSLVRFNNDNASASAFRALTSSSPSVRRAAAYVLSRRAHTPAQIELEKALGDRDPLTRAYAAAALGRIAAPSSYPLLVNALGDSDAYVRAAALAAISRVAEAAPEVVRAADAARVAALVPDPNASVRMNVFETLGWYARVDPTARQRLSDLVRSTSQIQRDLAATAAVRHLQLRSIPPGVSAWGMGQVLDAVANMPEGIEIRSRTIGHADPVVRAKTLSSIPDEWFNYQKSLALAALDDPDVIVRAAAIERYGAVGGDDIERQTQRLVEIEERERKAPQNDARVAAINALGRNVVLTTGWRHDFLRPLLADDDPVVRRVAADLIETSLELPRPQYTPLPVTRPHAEYVAITTWARAPHTATIRTTRGDIRVTLHGSDAPVTAWNFAQLANKKFFDDTTFMRVVPNYVIQGGDPRNDTNGWPGYFIRDEINMRKYGRGTVGMALAGPDTGGSQFFITHAPQPHLDGGYTVFGDVTQGMDVVDRIERGERVTTVLIDQP